MFPPGIIYQAPSLAKKISYQILRTFGGGLISFAIVGIIFSFWPIVKEEYLYRFAKSSQIKISGFGSILARINAEESNVVLKETTELGLDPYFSINISKINARANIIANVDPGNKDEYLFALTQGVAHAKGTNFPGQGKSIFLFSHSTDSPLNFAQYNAVFYLLRKLEKGDNITIYFLDKKFEYEVTDKFITDAGDTGWLSDPPSQGFGEASRERLVLQTCDPPGTSWNRLIVIAKPI